MISSERRSALIEMLIDYCMSKGHVYRGLRNHANESTDFYVNNGYYIIKWSECKNIYTAFKAIIDHIDKPDVDDTRELWSRMNPHINNYKIKDVIFNPPATIVFWMDGSKTVVKCQEDDEYDAEKGLAMAITKKFFGNDGKYYNEIKKWVGKYEETNLVDYKINNPFKFSIPELNYPRDIIDSLIKAATTTRPRKLNLRDKFDDDVNEIIDKAGEERKNKLLEKVNNVLKSFDLCKFHADCTSCAYKHTYPECDREQTADIKELLIDFRYRLTKDDA